MQTTIKLAATDLPARKGLPRLGWCFFAITSTAANVVVIGNSCATRPFADHIPAVARLHFNVLARCARAFVAFQLASVPTAVKVAATDGAAAGCHKFAAATEL